MASHYDDDRDFSRRVLREERVDERDPRYFDAYGNINYNSGLVARPRDDPAEAAARERQRGLLVPVERDVRRTRSADPGRGYYQEDYEYRRYAQPRYDQQYDREHDRRRRNGRDYYEEEGRERYEDRRSKNKSISHISKEEKIIAAVAGAALLAGGKELYDRREAKEEGTEVQRNPIASAALAGFGALAAYQGAKYYSKQQARKDQKANYILQHGRDGYGSDYYSDDDEDYNPKEKKGHKNFLESALAATGLGAAMKSLTAGGHDNRSDTRSRGGSPTGSRASSGGRSHGHNKVQKAAIASLLAGATEAFRVSKEPGSWKGEKTKRILTAAAGAATVDAAHGADHGKLGLAESVIGGLVGNRLINGSKNDIEEDRATGRSRSRSRAHSRAGGSNAGTGLAALATAGLGALGAKKVLDRSRSRSRGRDRSYDSNDSRNSRHDRHRSRSRSIIDKARGSFAKLGIGSGAVVAANENRRDQDEYSDRGSRRGGRRDDDYYDDDRGHGRNREYGSERGGYDRRDRRDRRSEYSSESDIGDSDEDERKAKKMKGKQFVTAGLAAVATIHAANEVYHSMEKRKARKRAVDEGRLDEAEAKKLKSKARLQDAAAVGIAALGIKGAIEEMKGVKECRNECKKWHEEKARRHEKRLERQKRQKMGPRRRSSSWSSASRPQNITPRPEVVKPGPFYPDDNPYGALHLEPGPLRRGSR